MNEHTIDSIRAVTGYAWVKEVTGTYLAEKQRIDMQYCVEVSSKKDDTV